MLVHILKIFIATIVIGLVLFAIGWVVSQIVITPAIIYLQRSFGKLKDTDAITHKSSLSGKVTQNIGDTVKELTSRLIHEFGFSAATADALLFGRQRVTLTTKEWAELAKKHSSMMAQGFSDNILAIHYGVSQKTPTAARLTLLDAMVRKNVPWQLLGATMDVRGYDLNKFEEAIRLHDVEDLKWVVAINLSF